MVLEQEIDVDFLKKLTDKGYKLYINNPAGNIGSYFYIDPNDHRSCLFLTLWSMIATLKKLEEDKQ